MNTKMIAKLLRVRLSLFRNRDWRLTELASRRPVSEVRRDILQKLSIRLNKKLISSS